MSCSKTTSLLTSNEFQMSISRLPSVEYSVQKINIPSLALTPVEYATPFNKTPQFGDKLQYSELSVSFLVDEDMKNYREIHDWMVALSAPQKFTQRAEATATVPPAFADITLLTMNSNMLSKIQLQFMDCFPSGLSDINFDVTASDTTYAECTVSFAYSYFQFV